MVRGDGCAFEKVVGIERLGVTGGASKASDKCSFAKISGNNKDWCNGRGKPAPLRKARGIVPMRKHINAYRRLQYGMRVG